MVEITTSRYLGTLCHLGHDWGDTGLSVRMVKGHTCILCGRTARKRYEKRKAAKAAEIRAERAIYRALPSTQALLLKREKERQLAYYQANRDKMRAYELEYRQANRSKISARVKRHYRANKDRLSEYGVAYRKANPEKSKVYYQDNKVTINAKRKVERSTPKYRTNNSISVGINRSLRGAKRGQHWEDLVGFTLDELMAHLEAQFKDGMTWENRSEWHIDHVLPISSFNFTSADDPDFKLCWALDNLQPLWALDNMHKHATISPEYQPELLGD